MADLDGFASAAGDSAVANRSQATAVLERRDSDGELTESDQSDPAVRPETQIKFASGDEFMKVLRKRVDDYFTETGRPRRDCPAMYVKTAVIMAWFAASYAGLVFWSQAWWQACLAAVSLGASMACIGFNIQHDGSHGAYSRHRWINTLMGMTLDLLGGSSYIWKKTHNLIHHSFTNITGHDGDIDLGVMGRLSPHQKQYPFHRIQHLYLWLLYGLITLKWQFLDDTTVYLRGQHSQFNFSRPKGWDLVVFLGGKISFLSLAFVLPMTMHSWTTVLAMFLLTSFFQGVLLSVVFQLAHCVEDADFPLPIQESGRMSNSWSVHQLETTANFARRNPIVTWFSGGLNFQVEHHLFPQICHVNYPAVSRILESTCREYGVRYLSHDTVLDAVRSHYRWLRRMGNEQTAA